MSFLNDLQRNSQFRSNISLIFTDELLIIEENRLTILKHFGSSSFRILSNFNNIKYVYNDLVSVDLTLLITTMWHRSRENLQN